MTATNNDPAVLIARLRETAVQRRDEYARYQSDSEAMIVRLRKRVDAAESALATARAAIRSLSDYMDEPVGSNDFYVKGVKNRYESLADLYDEEMPERIRAAIRAAATTGGEADE